MVVIVLQSLVDEMAVIRYLSIETFVRQLGVRQTLLRLDKLFTEINTPHFDEIILLNEPIDANINIFAVFAETIHFHAINYFINLLYYRAHLPHKKLNYKKRKEKNGKAKQSKKSIVAAANSKNKSEGE